MSTTGSCASEMLSSRSSILGAGPARYGIENAMIDGFIWIAFGFKAANF